MAVTAYPQALFKPEIVEAIGIAFDAVRDALEIDDDDETLHEIIAKMLVKAASEGERDPIRLRNAALAQLHSSCIHPGPMLR